MRKYPVLLCVSVCVLFAGMSATTHALPQERADVPFARDQESTRLTLFCQIGFFDSTLPVSAVPPGQQGNTVALSVTQNAAPLAAPEPSSLIFLAIGLGLFGVRMWLRRRPR